MTLFHLNCGSGRILGGVGLFGNGGLFAPARIVVHCLLIETGDGLLLVDTGPGMQDCLAPSPFVRLMLALGGFRFDPAETAVRQVERLGYRAEDVRHVALTHFHYDHAGGLPDFPWAQVHLSAAEHEAVTQPRDVYDRLPCRAEHWAHGPRWTVHGLEGDRWFGFDCTPWVDLGGVGFHLVPLPGHTRGHSAVALRTDGGWLLYCGDAYTYHGEVDPDDPRRPPYRWLFRPFFDLNRSFRRIGEHAPRLRELLRAHGDQVDLFCTHDPWDLDRFG